MENVLNPCQECPEALSLFGGEERGKSTLDLARTFWTSNSKSKPKTRATGLQNADDPSSMGLTQKAFRANDPCCIASISTSVIGGHEPKDAWSSRLLFLTKLLYHKRRVIRRR
jgi:hypothetical protein